MSREIDELDEFDFNSSYISECCGAPIYGETCDDIGICSQCKEWSGIIQEPEEE